MQITEDLEMAAMRIISNVGTARSNYIEAIHEAKQGHYLEAEKLIEEGDEIFAEGHDAHLKLLQQEAEGQSVVMLLILHAEDQLMSAEGFKIIANELIDVYKRFDKLEK
ncbi:MAG: PTS lactose/cellobiose transporter subunit IIA [Selenomonadaceae bacterium]|nr:PTS lactose/cellobiose transporter subunit IIA [Selenomonadaceae bacterium]